MICKIISKSSLCVGSFRFRFEKLNQVKYLNSINHVTNEKMYLSASHLASVLRMSSMCLCLVTILSRHSPMSGSLLLSTAWQQIFSEVSRKLENTVTIELNEAWSLVLRLISSSNKGIWTWDMKHTLVTSFLASWHEKRK